MVAPIKPGPAVPPSSGEAPTAPRRGAPKRAAAKDGFTPPAKKAEVTLEADRNGEAAVRHLNHAYEKALAKAGVDPGKLPKDPFQRLEALTQVVDDLRANHPAQAEAVRDQLSPREREEFADLAKELEALLPTLPPGQQTVVKHSVGTAKWLAQSITTSDPTGPGGGSKRYDPGHG